MIYVYCTLLLSISGTGTIEEANIEGPQFFCCRLIQLQHSPPSQFHGECDSPSVFFLTLSSLCVAGIGREKEN